MVSRGIIRVWGIGKQHGHEFFDLSILSAVSAKGQEQSCFLWSDTSVPMCKFVHGKKSHVFPSKFSFSRESHLFFHQNFSFYRTEAFICLAYLRYHSSLFFTVLLRPIAQLSESIETHMSWRKLFGCDSQISLSCNTTSLWSVFVICLRTDERLLEAGATGWSKAVNAIKPNV